MTRSRRALCIVALGVVALTLGGCTANLVGRRSPSQALEEVEKGEVDKKTGEFVGIPYYLTKPTFIIQVKGLRGGKKANPVHELVMVPVPDTSQRYEVALKSGTFTNDVFNLELLPDGRLVTLGAESADQTGEIIKSLGSFVGSFAKAVTVAGALAASDVLDNVKGT